MERLEILPTLNKEYILSKISQEQIFEYYLQVPIEIGNLIKTPSVIRTGDKDPTFSFYYNEQGKLRAKDHAGYFWGDCFDLVAYILHLSANDKKSFNVILDQIARDFRLHKYEGANPSITGSTYDSRDVSTKIKTKTIIQFQPRHWNKIDAEFWKAGNINSILLEEGKVYPCQYIWVNSNVVYNFVPKDPAYAYFFGQNDIKIYFPMRDTYRFISNSSYLQGKNILKVDEIGIITKSYKDVLSMRSFGISAVAPSSETVPISKEDWFNCKNTCTHWFSLMDFDRTGILMARKLRNLYGIQPLFFSNYKPLQKKSYIGSILANNYSSFLGVKDFYDYVKNFGKDSTLELIQKTKDFYSERFEGYNEEMYNNLNWINNEYKTLKICSH